ncbi:uncharacterized protein tamo [Chelonus insularis]|uniref:uncharacterized protein tamo n=1 Tax=Chelonus insularis TaxID=460826 RepID=UPI00158DAB19|nr:uncharacterized protein LOC118074567 [Chelonus insularis]
MLLNGMSRGIMMDQLEELSINLEKSHLAYLQIDESPSKLEQRHKLEGIIKEYLHLVPHENKYIFPETAHILHRSAATVNEFSGYRACSAWTAISLYAANLLAQPWRKEYRTLRTYSGYYKHEIEANLIGAELMFELMGYKHTGLGVLTLEGPIDPDKVSYVSRDAIVAFVECQIIKEIWEKVSQTFTISWLQVLEFRESHVGTPEQAVRALNHRFWERMYQSRLKLQNYHDLHFIQPAAIDTIPATTAPHHVIGNYKPSIPTEPDYRYPTENVRYYQSLQSPLINGFHNVYGCIPPVNNRVYDGIHRDYYVHSTPHYGAKIPTGQLIELEPPLPVINYEKSRNRRYANRSMDQVDFSSRLEEDNYNKIDRKPIKTSTSLDSASNESWDFVYRSLNNLGYSKDIAEREDVLRKKNSSKSKSSKTINEHEDKYESHRSQKKNHNSSSNGNDFHNNRSSLQLIDLYLSNENEENQGNAEEKNYKHNQASTRCSKNYDKVVDLVNHMSIRSKDEESKKNDKWNCSTCTYLNTSDREICEMCNKSRWKGNEDRPLASGGKECPKCTLVNEKDALVCAVCNSSLKDSPTYI